MRERRPARRTRLPHPAANPSARKTAPTPRKVGGPVRFFLGRYCVPSRAGLFRGTYRLIRALSKSAVIVATATGGAATIALAVTYPLPTLLATAVIVTAWRSRGKILDSHGTARFAVFRDAEHAGLLFDGDGMPVGDIRAEPRLRVRPLFDKRADAVTACRSFLLWFRPRKRGQSATVRLNGVVSTLTVAPPGAGKTSGQLVPFLRTLRQSCVVVDGKAELARLTAGHRLSLGHEVVLLDPFGVSGLGPSATYDPISGIRPDDPLALDRCKSAAQMMIVRTGQEKERHWDDSAELWLAAMIALVVFHGTEEGRSINAVRVLLADVARLTRARKYLKESAAADGLLAQMACQLDHYQDKELNSVITSVNRHLSFAYTPAIATSLAATSFDPSKLRQGQMTVYVVIPPQFQRSHSGYTRFVIGSLLTACVDQGLEATCPGRCHFVLEDAAQLGRLECLIDALNLYRGYGIRLHWFFQSLGQLASIWPEDKGQTIMSGCSQTFYAVRDLAGASQVSQQLGQFTAVLRSGGRGHSSGHSTAPAGASGNASASVNDNWAEHGRFLLRVEDVLCLDESLAITFTPGCRPLLTRIVPYFVRPAARGPSRWLPLRDFFDAASLLLVAVLFAAGLAVAVLPAASPRGERDGRKTGIGRQGVPEAPQGAAAGDRRGAVPEVGPGQN